MKIKKREVLDFLILYWMMIYIFAISWLAYLRQGAFVLCILILIRLVLSAKRTIYFQPLYIGALLCVIYPIVSFKIFSGNLNILYNNMLAVLPTTLVLIYIAFICKFKKKFVINFLKKQKFFFNGYMVINIPVLLLQLKGYYFLAGRHPESITNFYVDDLTSGLFGYNGTGLLTMYFGFLIVYNISLYKNNEIKRKKMFFIYNIILTTFIMYVATRSDNKALFIIVPMLLIIYYIEDRMNKDMSSKKKLLHLLSYVFKVAAIVTIFIFIVVPIMGLGEIFQDIFQKIQTGWLLSNSAHGSAERLGMIAYALNNKSIRWFGAGIAKYDWQEPYAFHFVHFGISDFGAFLCLGGVIYISLVCVFLISIYKQLIKDKTSIIMLLFGSIIILLYTQFLTVLSTMCSWCFFILIISKNQEKYKYIVGERKADDTIL